MSLRVTNLQQWLTKNRVLLWWVIFLPLLIVVVVSNSHLLQVSSDMLNDSLMSFQYKICNSPTIIILARVLLVAVGIVIIMICILFPLLRVGKEGVQWTKELEEELVRASGEIAGEEISDLVKEESFRWSLIHGWIKMKEPEKQDAHLLLRELIATIWDAFPTTKLSLNLVNGKNSLGITHPLLSKLVLSETLLMSDDERTYGVKLPFEGDDSLLLRIYTSYPEGFSQIDERFLLVLGEIFLQKVIKSGAIPQELLMHFDQTLLTLQSNEVYNEGG